MIGAMKTQIAIANVSPKSLKPGNKFRFDAEGQIFAVRELYDVNGDPKYHSQGITTTFCGQSYAVDKRQTVELLPARVKIHGPGNAWPAVTWEGKPEIRFKDGAWLLDGHAITEAAARERWDAVDSDWTQGAYREMAAIVMRG